MLLKAALNGARPKAESKFLPHSLDEIKKEVAALYDAGSKMFHIYCYSNNGNESPKSDDVVLPISGFIL